MAILVAISKSGFVRTVQTGAHTFEVQALAIRGETKIGQSPFWKKLFLTWDCEQACNLMDFYTGEKAA